MNFIFRSEDVRLVISLEDALYLSEISYFNALFQNFDIYNESEATYPTLYLRTKDKDLSSSVPITTVIVCDTTNPQWRYWVMYDIEHWFMNMLQCSVFHSSCVKYRGKYMMFMGKSMSGKTTLAYELCQYYGAEYIDDDAVFYKNKKCFGLGFPLALRGNPGETANVVAYTDDAVMQDRKLIQMKNHTGSFVPNYIFFTTFSNAEPASHHLVEGGNLYQLLLSEIKRTENIKHLFLDANSLIQQIDNSFIINYDSTCKAVSMIDAAIEGNLI